MKTYLKNITVVASIVFLTSSQVAFASEVTGSFVVGTTTPPVVVVVIPPTGGGGSPTGGGGTGGLGFSPVSLKGDANKDGKVDVLDFVLLMANWGQGNSGNIADFSTDNKVDILDFVLLMANWSK